MQRIMPAFSNLVQSDIVQYLKYQGKQICSLMVVGQFLQYVGYQMLLDLNSKHERQTFYSRYKARRIDVVINPGGSGLQYHTQVERIDS